MFAQFFGSYLLSRNAVTADQLTQAISKLADTHIKLGTLAMHKGYMTASEVDEVCFLQTREDKRFGEIALEHSYLFEDQLEDLLLSQNPDYLLLGQTLVDMGYLTYSDLEGLMIDYQSDNDLDEEMINKADASHSIKLIENFFTGSNALPSEYALSYLNLIFNNLVRFIGEDFTPLSPVAVSDYNTNYMVTQSLKGKINVLSGIDMTSDVAIQFASRYAKMEFCEFDEYVKASLEDFLNLHNGLFSVNMSNLYSVELELLPPQAESDPLVKLEGTSYVIPVIYPFGTVYLVLSFS